MISQVCSHVHTKPRSKFIHISIALVDVEKKTDDDKKKRRHEKNKTFLLTHENVIF